MILITTADFTGRFQVNLNTANTPLLQACIDDWEKHYLCHLLGVELAELFIADLNNVSQEARFTVIQDEFYLDHNSCVHHSRGLVYLLTACCYYHYVTDHSYRVADSGITYPNNEAQTVASPLGASRASEVRWNEMLNTAAQIQWYVTSYAPQEFADNEARMYPEYNGQCFEPRYGAML